MRRRITFRGRVQGVGFRATARAVALRHPVTGWVKNEPDGTVLMEVQGSAEAIDGYLGGLREAMGRNIAAIDGLTLPDVSGESEFEIRY